MENKENAGTTLLFEDSLPDWYDGKRILLAKCLGQLIQGFSCNISVEDLLHKLRL